MKKYLFSIFFLIFGCSDENELSLKKNIDSEENREVFINYAYIDPSLEYTSIDVMEDGRLDVENTIIIVNKNEIKKTLERYFHPIYGGPPFFSIDFNMDALPKNIYDILKTIIETLNENKWRYQVCFLIRRTNPHFHLRVPIKYYGRAWMGDSFYVKNWSDIVTSSSPYIKEKIGYLELINQFKKENYHVCSIILSRESCKKNQIIYLFNLLRILNKADEYGYQSYRISLEL